MLRTPFAPATVHLTPRTHSSDQPLDALVSEGIELLAEVPEHCRSILTPEALRFVATLQRTFHTRRQALLQARRERQRRFDAGELPTFLPETASIRAGEWQVAPIPDDLQDRRVEITGPVDRKMVINALNSGANCYMADLEDSHAPTWKATLEGQVNLRDAIDGTIDYVDPRSGKHYALNSAVATLIVRPRGWHLDEAHVRVDGRPVSAALFDFGLYFYHNAQRLIFRGKAPYFYLPKMESHLEARLWNDVFLRAQRDRGIRPGTIRATVLIETLLAAFEMDEILYELREHAAGLNCGRWDYIFSIIKTFRNHPQRVLPNRQQVTMLSHCMRAYSRLAVQTCHRRGASAIGGMAAQIPIKNDPQANANALQKVGEDKRREVRDGHDGTWVAHPGLVAVAKEEFDNVMFGPNQINRKLEDIHIAEEDLLRVPEGSITEDGLRTNIRVGVQYLEAWLRGNGCVPLYNLMEDAATAEISRAQIWQWLHHNVALEDGRQVTVPLFRQLLTEELQRIRGEVGDDRFNHGEFERAIELFQQIVEDDQLTDFLTTIAYPYLA